MELVQRLWGKPRTPGLCVGFGGIAAKTTKTTVSGRGTVLDPAAGGVRCINSVVEE
jgi:hypothetical protein